MKRKRRNSSLETDKLAEEIQEFNSTNQYGIALVRLVINKLAEERNLIFGRIDYLFKHDDVPKNIRYDYDNLFFTQFSIPILDVPKLILNMGSGKNIHNQHFDTIHNDYNGSWTVHVDTSNKKYGYIKCEYPFTHYMAKLWNTSYLDPYAPVVGKDLGPYPNTSKAVIDLLDLGQAAEDGWLNEHAVIIVVPDYRARIKKMKIKKDTIQLEVESKFLNDEDLMAQFYIDGKGIPKADLTNGIAEVASPKDPKEIFAVVMEKNNAEVLDYIHHNVRWTGYEESVEKEIPEDIVREWINRGENEYVEFKEVLTHADDVIKSVVAFANTQGGVILLGVKDDCSIVGYEEQIIETKNRFERMIAEKCDPPVDFNIEQVDLGQKVTVLKIPRGKNKIYSVTNGGIYVRRESSDRFIKPSELIEIFENKNKREDNVVF